MKKSKIILLILLVLVLCGIVVSVFLLAFKEDAPSSSPEDELSKALSEAFSPYDFPFQDASEKLFSLLSNSYSYNSDWVLKELDFSDFPSGRAFTGSGCTMNGQIDQNNHFAFHTLDLRYIGFEILKANLYWNDDTILLEMPDFYNGHLVIPAENLGTAYNSSPIASTLNWYIPEDLAVRLSISPYEFFSLPDLSFLSTFPDTMELLQELYEESEISCTGETRNFYRNNKEVTGTEFCMELDKENVLACWNQYYSFYQNSLNSLFSEKDNMIYILSYFLPVDDVKENLFSSSDYIYEIITECLVKDHEIYFYLDNHNQLIAVSYQGTFSIENQNYELSCELQFNGENYPGDNIEGSVILHRDNEDEIKIDLAYERFSNDVEDHYTLIADIKSYSEQNRQTDNYTLCAEYSYVIEDRILNYSLRLAPPSDGNTTVFPSDDSIFEFIFTGSILEENNAIHCDINQLALQLQIGDVKNRISVGLDAYYYSDCGPLPGPGDPKYDVLNMNSLQLIPLVNEIITNLNGHPLAGFLRNYIQL